MTFATQFRLALAWTCGLALASQAAEPATPKLNSSLLFQNTNVWNVHLEFSPDQWDRIEPKQSPGAGPMGFPGGGPGGPGGFRMPPNFGAGLFLSPAVIKDADANADGRLTEKEFTSLAEKWFAAWDTNKSGKITLDQTRAGLESTLRTAGPNPGLPGPGAGGRSFLQGAEGRRNGLASAMGIDFPEVQASLQFDQTQFTNIAIRYKGNGTFMQSRGSLKRSFKIGLNQFIKTQKLAGVAKLNLHNNVTDPAAMNESLAYRLYRDAGVAAPRSAYARVSVTVPEKFDQKFLGLYSLIENVDADFLDHHFKSKKGALLKPVTPSLFADLGDDWKNYKQTYDPKTDLTPAQQQRVIQFAKFVTHASDADFAARLPDFLDLDQFARYLAVTVWLSDIDGILGPGQNYYLHLHPETQRFTFIPWDQDHSFGHFQRGSQEQRENLSLQKPWMGENRFLDRIFKVEAVQKLYREKMTAFSKTIFEPGRFAKQIDELAPILRPIVAEESDSKLAQFDRSIAGETDAPGGGFGGFMRGGALKPIKPFVKIRAQSISDQLAGKSEGVSQNSNPFGPPGGGPPGMGPRPGGPGGFNPTAFLATAVFNTLDANKDSTLTQSELTTAFTQWYKNWNKDASPGLSREQIEAGLNKEIPLFPGFGPPQR